jgi:hypothetical protein
MKGIIIPAIEKYENLLYNNIKYLRELFNCNLPIEIWQIGQEISDNMKKTLESNQEKWNIIFKNVNDYTDNPEHWRGYQIKAFVLKYTNFDEIILCDCDSVFLISPEIIFEDSNYITKGTFFFKDFLRHIPKNNEEEENRKIWFNDMFPDPPQYLPDECQYLYNINTDNQQMWFYQESGVVFLNKNMHPDIIETVYKLNENHKEIYKYIHGDKETFWIACLLCKKSFHMNKYPGFNLEPDINMPRYLSENIEPALTHMYRYKGEDILFYSQKGYPDSKKITKKIVMDQLQ